jgi:hypothetical protein
MVLRNTRQDQSKLPEKWGTVASHPGLHLAEHSSPLPFLVSHRIRFHRRLFFETAVMGTFLMAHDTDLLAAC